MLDFGDGVTGKFFLPSDLHGEIPKFGFFQNADGDLAFAKGGVQVGRFPLQAADIPGGNGGYKANLWEFGPITTPEEVALTFKAAATAVGARGRGNIILPPIPLIMGANPDTAVGPDEGLGLLLDESMSNITFTGTDCRSVLIPVSNKIEMFAIDGAANTRFRNIIFDNRLNGVLHGAGHNPPTVPGTGTAGQGNAANCAVRQYTGANVAILGCEFWDIFTASQYIGDVTNKAVLDGDVIVLDCYFDGVVMGLLTMQPRAVVFNRNLSRNGINGEAVPPTTPGHDLYVADTTGAHPLTVECCNNTCHDRESSPWKIRKGISQVATGNVTHDCGKGLESHRGRIVTITGNTLKVADTGTIDSKQSGIEITGCVSAGVVGMNTIDVSGTNAYGMYVRPAGEARSITGITKADPGVVTYTGANPPEGALILITGVVGMTEVNDLFFLVANVDTGAKTFELTDEDGNDVDTTGYTTYVSGGDFTEDGDDDDADPGFSALNNLSILDNTVVNDLSGTSPKEKFFSLNSMVGGECRGNKAIIAGDVALVGGVFGLQNCADVQCSDNARRSLAAGTPSGSDRVYVLDIDCRRNSISWKRKDIDVAPTANTVNILGDAGEVAATLTTVFRNDPMERGTWLPAPNFSVNPEVSPGVFDFTPAIATQIGWWTKVGDQVTAGCDSLTWDNNAYSGSVSGALRVTGLPWTVKGFGANIRSAVSFHTGMGTTTDSIGALIGNGEDYFTFRTNVHASAGTGLTTAHCAASGTGFGLGFQMAFRVNEA